MSLFSRRPPQQQMTQAQAQLQQDTALQRQKGMEAMRQAQARRPNSFGAPRNSAPVQQAGGLFGANTGVNPNPTNANSLDFTADYKKANMNYDPFNPLDNAPAVANPSPIGTTGTGGGTTQSANPLQGSSGMGTGASSAAYMAKGGKVKSKAKVKKYAKGGSVSSASKRADGCATKGRTKGRML